MFVFVGKDFLGQPIKVEFAEKRVPKGGFGRGGGRGAVVFLLFWINCYATWHILALMLYSVLAVEWLDLAKCFVVMGSIVVEWYQGCFLPSNGVR